MSLLAQKMRKYWDSTNARTAHLGLSGESFFLEKRFHDLVISRMDVRNKTILDFGCGGGLLGKVVLEAGARKYIGFDVSRRSLQAAIINLLPFSSRCEFVTVDEHRFDFRSFAPDIFVCLACMIHFPTDTYFRGFLKEVDRSGAQRLVLEIRHGEHRFRKEAYSTHKDVIWACITDEQHVTDCLPSYYLLGKSAFGPSDCQILWYERKEL